MAQNEYTVGFWRSYDWNIDGSGSTTLCQQCGVKDEDMVFIDIAGDWDECCDCGKQNIPQEDYWSSL